MYTKQTWSGRNVQYPNRFLDQDGNNWSFTPNPGTVTTPGTPFSAERMNHIEDGIGNIMSGGSGAPTSATTGGVGTLYLDYTTLNLYICTSITQSGTVWTLVGANRVKREQTRFTTSGTWTCPAGVTEIDAYLVGGGQSGSIAGGAGAGGAGGRCRLVRRIAVTPGQTYQIVVGAGGEAVSVTQNNDTAIGNHGGNTTAFGYTAEGGNTTSGTTSVGTIGGTQRTVYINTDTSQYMPADGYSGGIGDTETTNICYTNPYDGITYAGSGSAAYSGGSTYSYIRHNGAKISVGGGSFGGISLVSSNGKGGDGGNHGGKGGRGYVLNESVYAIGGAGGGSYGGGGGGSASHIRTSATNPAVSGAGASGIVIIYYADVSNA